MSAAIPSVYLAILTPYLYVIRRRDTKTIFGCAVKDKRKMRLLAKTLRLHDQPLVAEQVDTLIVASDNITL